MKIEKMGVRIILSGIKEYDDRIYLSEEETKQLVEFLCLMDQAKEIENLNNAIHGMDNTIQSIRKNHNQDINALKLAHYNDLKASMMIMELLANRSKTMIMTPKSDQ